MSALDQALRQIPFGYEANRVRSDVKHALNSPLLDAGRACAAGRYKVCQSSAPWSSVIEERPTTYRSNS